MIVYLSGKITGKSNYREVFGRAQKVLKAKGYTVLNPAILPEGLTSEKYMPICLAMIEACDAVVLIDDWRKSRGAVLERDYARYQGKKIIYFERVVTDNAESIDER